MHPTAPAPRRTCSRSRALAVVAFWSAASLILAGPGGSDPACFMEDPQTACGRAGVYEGGACGPLITQNGDCPQTNPSQSGYNMVSQPFQVLCKWQPRKVIPNQGCVNDGPERTYEASCKTGAGSGCG